MKLEKFRCMHCRARTYLPSTMRVKFSPKQAESSLFPEKALDEEETWADVYLCEECTRKWYWKNQLSLILPGLSVGLAGALFQFVFRIIENQWISRSLAAAVFALGAAMIIFIRFRRESIQKGRADSEAEKRMARLFAERRDAALAVAGLVFSAALAVACFIVPDANLNQFFGVVAALLGMIGVAAAGFLVWSFIEASYIGRSEHITQRAAAYYFFRDEGLRML